MLLRQFGPLKCKPNSIKTALEYNKVYKNLPASSMISVAKHFGVTRVRVWQMLNLLKLDPKIIDYLTNLADPRENNYWTERKLRKLIPVNEDQQYPEFQKLLESFKEPGKGQILQQAVGEFGS